MRAEIVTVTREEKRYVAEDGKQFSRPFDCQNYERRLAQKREMLKLERFVVSREPVRYLDLERDDRAIGYNDEWRWYRLETDNDKKEFFDIFRHMDSWLRCKAGKTEKEAVLQSGEPAVVIVCAWEDSACYNGRMFLLSDLKAEFQKLYDMQ